MENVIILIFVLLVVAVDFGYLGYCFYKDMESMIEWLRNCRNQETK